MVITIATSASQGKLQCYLINNDSYSKLLVLKDDDLKKISLVKGVSYRFEWHVVGSQDAQYKIIVKVDPPHAGFADFTWEKDYQGSHQDVGGFNFIL